MAWHEWKDRTTGERKWLNDEEYRRQLLDDAEMNGRMILGCLVGAPVAGIVYGLALLSPWRDGIGPVVATVLAGVMVLGWAAVTPGGRPFRLAVLASLTLIGAVVVAGILFAVTSAKSDREQHARAAAAAEGRADAARVMYDINKVDRPGYTEGYTEGIVGSEVEVVDGGKKSGVRVTVTGFSAYSYGTKYTVRTGGGQEKSLNSWEVAKPDR